MVGKVHYTTNFLKIDFILEFAGTLNSLDKAFYISLDT